MEPIQVANMTQKPRASIFIPVFNAEKTIQQAIESVLVQTWTNYELIIVNDASTDGTPGIIEQYRQHPQVRIYHNSTNLGMASNSNKGIGLCRGDYVTRLDADDFYAPEYLEKVMVAFAHSSSLAMVFTGAQLVFADGTTQTELPYPESWIKTGQEFLPQILRYCPVRAPSVSVRRDCYERLGGVLPELKIHIDWEMWARVAANGNHIGYIAEPLTYYRALNPGSCTSSAIVDATSPADCAIWLEYLAADKLPYQLTAEELQLLKQGMYDIVTMFAVYALEIDHRESVEKHLAFARTLLPPEITGTMQSRLYARAAEVYFMEGGHHLKGWRYLLQSLKSGFLPREDKKYLKLWARALLGKTAFEFVRDKTVARQRFPYS